VAMRKKETDSGKQRRRKNADKCICGGRMYRAHNDTYEDQDRGRRSFRREREGGSIEMNERG